MVVALLALFAGSPRTGEAHHSPFGMEQIPTVLEGELLEVNWRNPHVTFRLRVIDAVGEEAIWDMEGHSLFNLRRAGVTRESFPVGQRVTVVGRASMRADAHRMIADTMLLPDGRELTLWANLFSQFNDAQNLQDAESEDLGFFRVWTLAQEDVSRAVTQTNQQPFTDEAIEARASWDPLDNFSIRCEAPGMPPMMLTQNPLEFVDEGGTILLRTDYYDLVRIIHMEQNEAPANTPYSHLGYSVGHWESDAVLVIETTQINWPYLDNKGTPLSDEIKVSERFSLSSDQSRLDFRITITDPATFTEPAVLTGQWLALGDTIGRYQLDCPTYK
jgi:hypothetical protein